MNGKVERIPAGFHTVTPHLVVRGGAQAIEFYGRAFGAKELNRHLGPSGHIMHSVIQIGDSRLFLCDEFPDMKILSPLSYGGTPVTLHLYVEDPDALFNQAVAAGATVAMPMADMFWGARYGLVDDPYGHRWGISCRIKDVSPAELEAAAKAAFGGGCSAG